MARDRRAGMWAGERVTTTSRFSKWERWTLRNRLADLGRPGVYAIARSTTDLSGKPFSLRKEIINIGQSARSLEKRLKEFNDSISGKRGHGPSMKLRPKNPDYRSLASELFVAVAPFTSISPSSKAGRLRVKGEVFRNEQFCLAAFVEMFGDEPELNKKGRKYKPSLEDID